NNGTTMPDEVKKTGTVGATTILGGINRCPQNIPGLPVKNFIIEAWLASTLLQFLPDRAAIVAGGRPLEPLVIRVNAGDCVNVTFRNRLPASGVPEYTSFNEVPT